MSRGQGVVWKYKFNIIGHFLKFSFYGTATVEVQLVKLAR